eukprot:jgi/Psemu1/35627/gm1.35627_g
MKHELTILPEGTIDIDADPFSSELFKLEKKNQTAVRSLVEYRFNGGIFKKDAAHNFQAKRVTFTEPNMLKRQDRTRWKIVIDSMQNEKKQAINYTKLEQARRDVLYEWKLRKGPKNLKKLDLVDVLEEAKTKPPPSAVLWNEGGGDTLHRLEIEDIKMKDALLGKNTTD